MEELSNLVKALDLENFIADSSDLSYVNVFRNPNKLPITQIHLEKVSLDLRRDAPIESTNWSKETESRCFDKKIQIVPALSKVWLPESQPVFPYKPHNYEKSSFSDQNRKFLQTIHYLLTCNYHQFWCTVLFNPKIQRVLHSFLLSPILPHQIKYLDKDDDKLVYFAVLSHFRRVYERLLTFRETELEYMPENVAFKYLLEKKLLNLPIVVTLIVLYHETNLNFVNDLVSLYFSEQSAFQDKEIDELITQVIMTLEMIGGHVCGFESDAVIVPIAVEPKPLVFNIHWVSSVVNYLLNTISSVNMLLRFYKPATKKALDKGLPYRLTYTYEKVFHQLYEFINERNELEENQILSDVIYEEIALARSQFVDVYNCFVTYCFDKVLEFSGDSIHQQEFIEIYLQLMTAALEDEYFICDYHERYDVGAQNEMFSSCAEIDETRTQYILNCITCSKRHNRLSKALKCELKTLEKTREKYAKSQNVKIGDFGHQNGEASQAEASNHISEMEKAPPCDAEIEELILKVIDMFPHLGDGFVLECLKVYNFQADEVISAILEENLPPHLVDIPFDEIRIPPETSPSRPKLEEIKGKKSNYDDALKLLNDKKDVKQIKTFILDGIQYTNEYDDYDDEYDDRIDEATVPVRDHGTEDILKYNPNYDDAVSDTSYSEDEYDESGVPVQQNQSTNSKGKANFCEDPAAVRARYEARRQATGRGRGKPPPKKQDVVGKPKGQGQEKSVVANRDKKNTNKSSRANHNRRSGAQWKRSRGMVPS